MMSLTGDAEGQMKFQGHVGIVTGGGMGMGTAVATRWATEGAHVILTDVNKEAGEAATEGILEKGGEATFVHADITSEADWARVMDEAITRHGRIDMLHNNAGIHKFFEPTEDSMDIFEQIIDVNLRGVFLGCRAVLPHMKKAGRGAIVNTSSTSGLQGVQFQVPYSASKGGVLLLTRALARTYGPNNIRVNAICPGTIDTPMLRIAAAEGAGRDADAPSDAAVARGVPLSRIGTAEEIANVVTFLVSDEASYVTGAWIPVDGGMTA